MSKDKPLTLCIAVYDSVDTALADLDAIEQLHEDNLIATYDAAVIDQENGKPHIIRRANRPHVHAIPEALGFGLLPHKQLKEAADELAPNEAALILVGETTVDEAFNKAFDEVVTRAAKTLKRTVDVAADEFAKEMKDTLNS
jgi:uncharacterized membrane protein